LKVINKNYLKGCLITLIALIVFCLIGYFIYKNHVIANLGSLNSHVELYWNKYVQNLKEKNNGFTQQRFKNDSIKYYLGKEKLISLSECSKELEYNEYKLNQFAMSDSLKSDLNNRTNSILDYYNKAVKEYNVYRIIFPNSLIARKAKFRNNFNYFEIRYGVNNEKIMMKKKKVEKWIKNGGSFPE